MATPEPTSSSATENARAATPTGEPSELPKIIRFETLARCGEEIWIENGGQIYRLRRTKQGKLILTK
ncbi:MAG: hemin uptake protein HemP [Planctomycetota bacterium]|nr:hemin uptake protein HemP [Planctomycetota bacterium]